MYVPVKGVVVGGRGAGGGCSGRPGLGGGWVGGRYQLPATYNTRLDRFGSSVRIMSARWMLRCWPTLHYSTAGVYTSTVQYSNIVQKYIFSTVQGQEMDV